MEKFAWFVNALWKKFTAVGAVVLAFVVTLIVCNVIARRFFNAPIFGSTELVCHFILVVAALALPQNEWIDGNISMDLIQEFMKDKGKLITRMIINLICGIAFVYVDYLMIKFTVFRFQSGDITLDIHLPIWIFFGILSVGYIFMTFGLFSKAILLGYTIKTGKSFDYRYMAITSSGEEKLD